MSTITTFVFYVVARTTGGEDQYYTSRTGNGWVDSPAYADKWHTTPPAKTQMALLMEIGRKGASFRVVKMLVTYEIVEE